MKQRNVPIRLMQLSVMVMSLGMGHTVSAEPSGAACHVMTEGGLPGVILVDTQDLKLAETVALANKATTLERTKALTASVVQCILFPKGGSFSDPVIQSFFEKMDK